ncbi:hypothetical protein ElyMa_000845800 [Elysia marginata]|uniref:Uncharacterized protein n=1 Tax=Elysia marginata TaxID=1093978 RepID=A0AAV4H4G3_9GAST|nr:hypothetical protein ElyMa_000845800 [Elysia marginata]
MLAENEGDLQKLVNTVKEESEKCGLFINIRKTKIMELNVDVEEDLGTSVDEEEGDIDKESDVDLEENRDDVESDLDEGSKTESEPR